ncbi:MAG: hypothetical protein ABH851_00370 [Methanobacteriota archaeon]
MRSRRRVDLILAFLLISILVIGLRGVNLKDKLPKSAERILNVEYPMEGVQIVTVQGMFEGEQYTVKRLSYVGEGKVYTNFFDESLKDGLDWIIENTSEGVVFLSWWDYGHMIRGYAKRQVVVYAPSSSILKTLANKDWDPIVQGEFSSQEKIRDVGEALLTEDSSKTLEVMGKYGAEYLLVHSSDVEKSGAIAYAVSGEYEEASENTILSKAVHKKEIGGLNLVYEDFFIRIYEKDQSSGSM